MSDRLGSCERYKLFIFIHDFKTTERIERALRIRFKILRDKKI